MSGLYKGTLATVEDIISPKKIYATVHRGSQNLTVEFEEDDLRAANSTAINSTRAIVQRALNAKTTCNFGSLKIGTRVEIDGRQGTVVANPDNLTRYTVKFDDGTTSDANYLDPDFRVVNNSTVANAMSAEGVARNASDEAVREWKKYTGCAKKFFPLLRQAKSTLQSFQRECPHYADCMEDGYVDEALRTLIVVERWCQETATMSPDEFE